MKRYAIACWTAEDMHTIRKENGLKKWTDERAGQFLEKNEKEIKKQMCLAGKMAIEEIMIVGKPLS